MKKRNTRVKFEYSNTRSILFYTIEYTYKWPHNATKKLKMVQLSIPNIKAV